jgi:hypothetical protein
MMISCATSVTVVTMMLYLISEVFSWMHVLEAFDQSERNFIRQYRTSLAKTQDTTRDPPLQYLSQISIMRRTQSHQCELRTV